MENDGESIKQIEKIKKRWKDITTDVCEQCMFEAIRHERRVELAFEYHSFNDARRWGRTEDLHPNYSAK